MLDQKTAQILQNTGFRCQHKSGGSSIISRNHPYLTTRNSIDRHQMNSINYGQIWKLGSTASCIQFWTPRSGSRSSTFSPSFQPPPTFACLLAVTANPCHSLRLYETQPTLKAIESRATICIIIRLLLAYFCLQVLNPRTRSFLL